MDTTELSSETFVSILGSQKCTAVWYHFPARRTHALVLCYSSKGRILFMPSHINFNAIRYSTANETCIFSAVKTIVSSEVALHSGFKSTSVLSIRTICFKNSSIISSEVLNLFRVTPTPYLAHERIRVTIIGWKQLHQFLRIFGHILCKIFRWPSPRDLS